MSVCVIRAGLSAISSACWDSDCGAAFLVRLVSPTPASWSDWKLQVGLNKAAPEAALCLLQQETLHRDAKDIYLPQLPRSRCRNIIIVTFSLTESSLVTATGSQQLQQLH